MAVTAGDLNIGDQFKLGISSGLTWEVVSRTGDLISLKTTDTGASGSVRSTDLVFHVRRGEAPKQVIPKYWYLIEENVDASDVVNRAVSEGWEFVSAAPIADKLVGIWLVRFKEEEA